MQDLQEIFNRINETRKKQKDIRSAYKDALATSEEYQDVLEKIKVLRDRKKQIEGTIKEEFNSEFQKLDGYRLELTSDAMLLSDAALSMLMKGETVAVTDEFNNNYEPLFSVKFKKA